MKDEEQFKALLRSLPQPELPAGFTARMTAQLLALHRKRLRHKMLVWFIVIGFACVAITLILLAGHLLPAPVLQVYDMIFRYKWICLFVLSLVTLCQYIDGRIIENQFNKQLTQQ